MDNVTQSSTQDYAQIARLADEMRTTGNVSSLEIDNVAIQFWRAGTGERTLVLIHGNSAAKEVFFRQFSHFGGDELTLIAIDLPGHGCSDNAADPDSQYTIPGYAKIVHRLLERLNVRDYVLVGWSLGGNIALEMAGRDYPLRAMLIMGAPPVGPGAENFEKAYLPATFDTAASKGDPTENEITTFARAIYGRLDPVPTLFLETAQRTAGRARDTMVSHWLSGSDGCDQLSTARSWDKPICVVHGKEEPFVSLTYLENANWKNLWKDKIHLLDDSGHAPFLENPDVFNELLGSFALNVF